MFDPHERSVLTPRGLRRIGTWNLAGRWTDRHREVLLGLDCDVLLLTEVHVALDLPGYDLHPSHALMQRDKHWAAVATRLDIERLPDPHVASVAVRSDGTVICSSVLPWMRWNPAHAYAIVPWTGDQTERMASTVAAVTGSLQRSSVVWGGDWNSPLVGSLWGFSRTAQAVLAAAIESLDLQVPTAGSSGRPKANGPTFSIDHIAVPSGWKVVSTEWHPMDAKLSDHDPYVVEVAADPPREQG